MKKILLIDDNAHVRRAAREAFTRWGHEVVVVDNGAEGLREAQEGGFDAIVCDLEMPEMTGDEVYAQLSPEDQARFILYTGHVYAVTEFGGRMTVVEKSSPPAEVRRVLEALPQRGASKSQKEGQNHGS